jgi:hypothetical protein
MRKIERESAPDNPDRMSGTSPSTEINLGERWRPPPVLAARIGNDFIADRLSGETGTVPYSIFTALVCNLSSLDNRVRLVAMRAAMVTVIGALCV